MTVTDYEPNIEKALTKNDAAIITKIEYDKLKKISASVVKHAENILMSDITRCGITKSFVEYIVRNSTSKNISEAHKEIIIANAILPDDTKIAELLNINGFTYEHINIIINFRSLLKRNIIHNIPMDRELQIKYKAYQQIVDKIVELFKKEFGISNKTIILNRICEVIVTHPNYFEKRRNTKRRKR